MNITELKENFFALVPSHPPNDWEIEEHLENITELPAELQSLVLSQVPAIWSVSHSLCYSFLSSAGVALECLPADRMGQWVGDFLDTYEKEGLRAAQHFMADVEANFLCRIRGEAGVNFNDAACRLTPYARSIIKRKISLETGSHIYTDTESIYLPNKLTLCASDKDNFLLYKLIITFQLGLLLQGTYQFVLPAGHTLIQDLAATYGAGPVPKRLQLGHFFSLFPDQRLAEDIFTALEARRVSGFVAEAFTGLWHDSAKVRVDLADARLLQDKSSIQSMVLERLIQQVITGKKGPAMPGRLPPVYERIFTEFYRPAETVVETAVKSASIYAMLSPTKEPYWGLPPIFYVGRLNPTEATKGILRRQNTAQDEFVKALAAILLQTDRSVSNESSNAVNGQGKTQALSGKEEAGMLLFSPEKRGDSKLRRDKAETPRFMNLEGAAAELPASLRQVTEEIIAYHGHIPDDYFSAAQGLAGQASHPQWATDSPSGESLKAPITYDEWDFRRNGFRKGWCALFEKKLQPVKGTFVGMTLGKYQGILKQLKKQFEMLRTTERFVKRQRDGSEIDLDALIESIADTRAGKPAADRLFIRLQRDERDIAVLFLVDLSSSTEGWVNMAIKEALLLMGEALQELGDRFAICGFSGMRRTRSDFYRIKNFEEPYDEEIKGRIAAISPQEYTRMGPPLRHAVEQLQKIDARVRLLVTLSDGKPEDYDDYKGEYAIEDTRHALIEARSKGIHPFGITIDKQAHDYIGHMYGEANCIFVDEVRKLPARLPEIYRVLTT